MTKLIFIGGAPGSGKTTNSKLLQQKLKCPLIDFGSLRMFHLNEKWTNVSKKEEQMSFENLTFILRNYLKQRYKHAIVNDLQDFRIQQIPQLFASKDYKIFSLVLSDEQELKHRVLDQSRDSGFRNVRKALLWNRRLKRRRLVKNEFKIENSHLIQSETVKEIARGI